MGCGNCGVPVPTAARGVDSGERSGWQHWFGAISAQRDGAGEEWRERTDRPLGRWAFEEREGG